MLYTPKISGQAKTFRRAMLAHLQGISPSAGGTPCQFFFYNVFGKKCLYVFFLLNWCFYLYWLRDSVSPLCRIFFIPYLRLKLVISYSFFFFNWQNNCTCLFTHFKKIHSWDNFLIKFTVSHLILTFAITSTAQPPQTLYL